jgi:hypothetical protein
MMSTLYFISVEMPGKALEENKGGHQGAPHAVLPPKVATQVPWQVLIAGGDDWKHAAPLRAHDTATIQCDLDAYVRTIRRCLKHPAAVICRFTQSSYIPLVFVLHAGVVASHVSS